MPSLRSRVAPIFTLISRPGANLRVYLGIPHPGTGEAQVLISCGSPYFCHFLGAVLISVTLFPPISVSSNPAPNLKTYFRLKPEMRRQVKIS